MISVKTSLQRKSHSTVTEGLGFQHFFFQDPYRDLAWVSLGFISTADGQELFGMPEKFLSWCARVYVCECSCAYVCMCECACVCEWAYYSTSSLASGSSSGRIFPQLLTCLKANQFPLLEAGSISSFSGPSPHFSLYHLFLLASLSLLNISTLWFLIVDSLTGFIFHLNSFFYSFVSSFSNITFFLAHVIFFSFQLL